jgi:peptide/nickel transport system permease protein
LKIEEIDLCFTFLTAIALKSVYLYLRGMVIVLKKSVLAKFKKKKLAAMGLVIIFILILMGIFAPVVSPHDPYAVDLTIKLLKPCAEFPLGTDQLGRCILSRLIYGIRTSLTTAIFATVFMLAIGVPLGILAGYAGGWLDNIIMRLADIASTFPSGLCALAIVGVWGASVVNIMIVFVLLWWAPFARIVRSIVIKLKEKEFVIAAIASGSSRTSIILKHITLNAISPVIVLATLRIAAVIMHVAGFSFIGLGSQPPTADWGVMLSDSRQYLISDPLMLLWPGLAIMLAVFAFNMFGEGLNDVLIPSSGDIAVVKEDDCQDGRAAYSINKKS